MDEVASVDPKKAELKGVRGWLLFFCIGQVSLAPSNALQDINKLWDKIGPHPFPVVRQIAVIDTVVTVTVMLYGMIVGILIWRRHSAGRSLARQYLVVRMVVAFLVCALMVAWAYNFSVKLGPKMAFATVPWTALEIAVAILWWCYFTYSKRVRNTFPAQK